MMERIEEDVDIAVYERHYNENYSYLQLKRRENQPTHFSLTKLPNGFDEVKYYKIKDKKVGSY